MAIIAGRTSSSVPVISATIRIMANGAWAALPKQAVIPTMTYGAGLDGTPDNPEHQ